MIQEILLGDSKTKPLLKLVVTKKREQTRAKKS